MRVMGDNGISREEGIENQKQGKRRWMGR